MNKPNNHLSLKDTAEKLKESGKECSLYSYNF